MMSKNNETIFDIDNEFNDCIEINSASNQPVNILNFGLSDEQENLFKWEFPDTSILSNSTILNNCTDKLYESIEFLSLCPQWINLTDCNHVKKG